MLDDKNGELRGEHKVGSSKSSPQLVNAVPEAYGLAQNFPNPFNPETTIHYQLPESGHTKLQIYTVLGQRVATLVDDEVKAGYHQVHWNGLNEFGNQAASGIYIYRLEVEAANGEQFVATKKMNLLR